MYISTNTAHRCTNSVLCIFPQILHTDAPIRYYVYLHQYCTQIHQKCIMYICTNTSHLCTNNMLFCTNTAHLFTNVVLYLHQYYIISAPILHTYALKMHYICTNTAHQCTNVVLYLHQPFTAVALILHNICTNTELIVHQ